MSEAPADLTRFERAALALGRIANEGPRAKRIQYLYHRYFNRSWVKQLVNRHFYVDGIDYLVDLEPDRGVMCAGNHRSFFDQWLNMLALYERGATWPRKIYFPVRSNFFYENVAGVLINLFVGGVTMYPPIFRDPAKSHFNKDALERIERFLGEPGTLVGIHPEGTRGKGPDPYELLKAQPGTGQMIVKGRPIVVPFFINGVGNSFTGVVVKNYTSGARRSPIIITYGQPVDYSEFLTVPPRAAIYLKVAKKVRNAIIELIPREKELRAACEAGEIPDDDRCWFRPTRVRNGVGSERGHA